MSVVPNSFCDRISRSLFTVLLLSASVAEGDDTHKRTKIVSSEVNYVVTYSVSYSDNEEAKEKHHLADIYQPRGDGPFPTILMVHGGAWFAGNKAHVSLHARHAADAGYAVVAINYRLAPAHRFPAQLDDCRLALNWIAENADKFGFDTHRLAAYGYSAGAHLVSLLATTQNDTTKRYSDGDALAASDGNLKAIVAGGTPCEFSWIPARSERLTFWLGGSRKQLPDVYKSASPTSFVDAKDPPIFLFHGKLDRIVPITSVEKMKERLDSTGVDSILHVIPNADHFGAFVNREARKLAIEFLDEKLSREQTLNFADCGNE
jgi:acetyl esterase/lipase